ncbi:MAG TPA: hypothetical protein VHH15_08450 [Actinophytocola sp.]|nr:hypothetical protein [Actinophytocola sp.]
MGVLESLLTGVDHETVADNDRSGHPVAVLDDGERLVLTLTDEVQAALVTADEARLREVATPWSQTEEFGALATPDDLASVLVELGTLARDASGRGDRLYCWVCV